MIRVTAAMEIKYKVGKVTTMAGITRKSVLKSCMDREEREVGVNSVGESRMDKTGSGWKKVKGIGNVVLNTWKLHWISESK